MNPSEALEAWGLTPKEIKVYLACLELGKAKVQEVAKKTGIERTNNYSLLERLIKKGLVREIESAGKRMFIAESPEQLTIKLKERERLISQVLPELKSLYNLAPSKPKIRFYEGEEGYRAITNESLDSNPNEILLISNLSNLYEIIGGSDWDNKYYIPKRLEKGIPIRMLVLSDEQMKRLRSRDEKENRQTKFLPKDFPFEGSIWIFDDKVALISSSKELISVVIESQYISEMMRSMFKIIWQAAS